MHVIYAVINHFQASDDMHRKYVTKVTLLRHVIDNYADIPRRRPTWPSAMFAKILELLLAPYPINFLLK